MLAQRMRYQFGDCQFDADAMSLLRKGQRVSLQGKSLDLLHYLLQNAGRTISRDELLEHVWENIHLTDSAVGQAVMKVRKAIGDDDRSMLRTVHARGFQLAVPVSEVDADAVHNAGIASALRTGPWPMVAALLSVALVAGGIMWSQLQASDEVQATWWVAPFADSTGSDDLSWVSTGLQSTVTRMLSWSGQQVVAGPGELDHDSDLSGIRSFVGADFALKARVDNQAGGYRLAVELHRAGETLEFDLSGPDLAVLTRELVERCLDIADSGARPIWLQRGHFSDPLATELHARASEAMAMDEFDQAIDLTEAALIREPDNMELKVLLLEAQTPENGHAATVTALRALLAEAGTTLSGREQARLLHRLGDYLWYAGEIDSARALLEQAHGVSEHANPILRGLILNSLSAVLQSQGDMDRAWELATLAVTRFRDAGDDFHASVALSNLAYLADDWGRLDSARQLHSEALAIREQFQVPSLIAASRYGLARILRRSGDFAAAEAMLALSLAEARTLNSPFDLFDNLEELAELQRARGQFNAAWKTISEAHALAESEDDTLGIGWALSVRGKIRRDQARYDDARRWLEQAVDKLGETGETNEAAYASLHLAEALVRGGRSDAAQTILETLPDQLDTAGNLAIHLAHLNGLNSQSRDSEPLRQALNLARGSGAADLEAFIAMDLARQSLDQGNLAVAETMLAVARGWNASHYRVMALMVQFHQLNQDYDRASELSARLARQHPEYLATLQDAKVPQNR